MRCGYSSLQVLDWSLQISRLRFRLSTAPSHDLHASTSFARRYTQPLAAHRACAVSGAGRDRDRERERESPQERPATMPEMQQRSALLIPSQPQQRRLPDTSASHASSSTAADSDPHQANSLPPWIHVNDEAAPFLEPAPTLPNTRHYKVPPKYQPGRKLDAYRDAEPGLLSAPIADHQVRWIPFMQSGPNPREQRDQRIVRSDSWMRENVPIFNRAWQEEDEMMPESKRHRGLPGLLFRGKWLISPERQERSVRLFWRLLLKNAFVPLGFRVFVLSFSCAALGVAGTILKSVNSVNRDNDAFNQCAPRASTYMGIIVPAVAIPYIGYV